MGAGLGLATFVGREPELLRLQAALAARSDRPGVLVGGEAGIGKSRLVREFANVARSEGATVISGGCLELGADALPFAPFVEALGRLHETLGAQAETVVGIGRGELASLLPELGPPTAGIDRVHLFEGVRALFDRSPDPTVLVLEDLQWADQSSLELLTYLVRRLRHGRTLVAATFRSEEVPSGQAASRVITELTRSGRADRIELGRLALDDLDRLVREHAPTIPPAARSAISERSDGNPYLAEELAEAGWSAGDDLPTSLRDLLLLRVRSLSPPARRVLDVVALAGRPIDPALLEMAWEGATEALDRALVEAIAGALLTQPGSGVISLRHALVGEAVLRELQPREKMRLHARLGRILADRPDLATSTVASRAAELAGHWLGAGQDPEALEASFRAAEAAERIPAWTEARVHYERALELWPRVPDAAARLGIDHGGILDHAAYVLYMVGDAERAVELERAAIAAGDPRAEPARVGARHAALACYLEAAGHLAEIPEAAEVATALVPREPPSSDRVLALFALAGARLEWGRWAEAEELAVEAVRIAEHVPESPTEAWARALLGLARWELDDDVSAARELTRAIEIVESGLDAWAVIVGYANLLSVLVRLGDPSSTKLALAAYRAGAERRGLLRTQEQELHTWEAEVLFAEGEWDAAEALASRTLAEAPGERLGASLLALRGRIRVGRGALQAGTRDLTDALAISRSGRHGVRFHHSFVNASIGLAEAAIIRGETRRALELVDDTARALQREHLPPRPELHVLGLGAAADLATTSRTTHGRAGRDLADEAAAAAERNRERLDAPGANAAGRRGEDAGEGADADAGADTGPAGATVPGADARLGAAKAAKSSAGRTARILGTLATAEAGRAAGASPAHEWAAAAAALEGWREPLLVPYARYREAEALLAASRRDEAAAALRSAHQVAGALRAEPLGARIAAMARRARIDLPALAPPGRGGEATAQGRDPATMAAAAISSPASLAGSALPGDVAAAGSGGSARAVGAGGSAGFAPRDASGARDASAASDRESRRDDFQSSWRVEGSRGGAGDTPGFPGGAPPEHAAFALSAREEEVLALLAEGRTNREIGASLFISEKTASVHVTHILDKLGVASRGAAVAAAVRSGLLSVHDDSPSAHPGPSRRA